MGWKHTTQLIPDDIKKLVKIRPLWDGNETVNVFVFCDTEELKSDHCGMETTWVRIMTTQIVLVKIRPLWDGNTGGEGQ